MKKVFILIAVLLSVQVAMAQFDFCIGPKIGYQSQTLSGKKADINASFKNNFTAGVFARATIGDFIIQPELLYFKSGKTFNFDLSANPDIANLTLNPNMNITINQTNLALPIFLGYQLNAKLIKVRGNVGPVAYFLIGNEQSNNLTEEESKLVTVKDIETKKVTWGAALNVGLDVWRLTLDINYSFGLSNLFGESINFYNPNTGTPQSIVLDSSKQNIFTVTLGFKLL